MTRKCFYVFIRIVAAQYEPGVYFWRAFRTASDGLCSPMTIIVLEFPLEFPLLPLTCSISISICFRIFRAASVGQVSFTWDFIPGDTATTIYFPPLLRTRPSFQYAIESQQYYAASRIHKLGRQRSIHTIGVASLALGEVHIVEALNEQTRFAEFHPFGIFPTVCPSLRENRST